MIRKLLLFRRLLRLGNGLYLLANTPAEPPDPTAAAAAANILSTESQPLLLIIVFIFDALFC